MVIMNEGLPYIWQALILTVRPKLLRTNCAAGENNRGIAGKGFGMV